MMRSSFMKELEIKSLYDLNNTIAKDFLAKYKYPWEALKVIKGYIVELGKSLPKDIYEEISENVWVAKSAKVAPTAYLGGSAIVGRGTVVGNSVELKNCILFDSVQVPHFNYVGDSILGFHSHMGAGSITSNVKSDKTLVKIKTKEECVETGLKKFGAMLGDYVEVGCNSVLNPGTVIGKHSNVYPLSSVRGYIPENSIYKQKNEVVLKENRIG